MYFPQEEVEQVRPMHPIFRGATSQADSHLPLEPLKQKQRILSRSVEFESFDPWGRSSEICGERDQMCTTYGPKVSTACVQEEVEQVRPMHPILRRRAGSNPQP